MTTYHEEGSVLILPGGVFEYGPLANTGGGGGLSESSPEVLLPKLLLMYIGDCSLGMSTWGRMPRKGELFVGGGGPLIFPGVDVPGILGLNTGLCIPTPGV